MNEKQAKRLRRVEREFVRRHKSSMDEGPPVAEQARALSNFIRGRFNYLNHRERGKLMRRIMGGMP